MARLCRVGQRSATLQQHRRPHGDLRLFPAEPLFFSPFSAQNKTVGDTDCDGAQLSEG